MATKRFGISLLSKENYTDAYNEEVLVDKNTGEFLLKTRNGKVLSYDFNTKYKSMVNDIQRVMNNLNLYGTVNDINGFIVPVLENVSDVSTTILLPEAASTFDLRGSTNRIAVYANFDFLTEPTIDLLEPTYNDSYKITVDINVTDREYNLLYNGSVDVYANGDTKVFSSQNGIGFVTLSNIRANTHLTSLRPKYMMLNYFGYIVEA